MKEGSTRRQFIEVAAGGALGALLPNGTRPGQAVEVAAQSLGAGLSRTAVEAEMRRRARWGLKQPRLVVDYYRIGRKIAYPLPLAELVVPEVRVPGLSDYPWGTWLSWSLEERIACLGWAAQWLGDQEAREAAAADLAALARWPSWGEFPSLNSAHLGRTLWRAAAHWPWVDEALRHSLRDACIRHVESVLPACDKTYGAVHTKEDVLRPDGSSVPLHNIPLIATVGAALTAAAAGHAAAAVLNARVQALFGALLDLRTKGHSEGLAYDGYVLDFVADWLGTLPDAERSAILDHPNLSHYLDQSYMLGAPGAAEQVAELSDVEPRQMPFHLSAQAKLLRLQPDPVRAWLMGRCPLDVLRGDALAALGEAAPALAGQAPAAGALDAHYAAVLRSGWEANDLAVAVSCSNSSMGHIHSDSGTLVIGTRGRWLVADPGYQQYIQGEEREFTLGPAAHNGPLINSRGPSQKRPRRIVLEDIGPSVHRVAIDLTACYPIEAAVKTVVRHVWLSGRDLVVVADQIEAQQPPSATYHWHGHPDVAWWFEGGWALLALDEARLWVASSGSRLSGADLERLPGSRGQLSLASTVEAPGPVVWWVFALAADRPDLQTSADGREVRVLGRMFSVRARLRD